MRSISDHAKCRREAKNHFSFILPISQIPTRWDKTMWQVTWAVDLNFITSPGPKGAEPSWYTQEPRSWGYLQELPMLRPVDI